MNEGTKGAGVTAWLACANHALLQQASAGERV